LSYGGSIFQPLGVRTIPDFAKKIKP